MASYATNLPINNTFSITAYFGQQGSYWKNGHKGVDLIGANKKIYSVCDGEVTVVGYDENGWGRYVSVMPSGQPRVRFILCHLVKDSVKVKKGDKVSRLTVLGTMGSSGNSTGVHVHAEMRIDNTPVDITPYLLIPNKVASNLKDTDFKFDPAYQNSAINAIIERFDNRGESDQTATLLSKIEDLEKRLALANQKIENAKNALN